MESTSLTTRVHLHKLATVAAVYAQLSSNRFARAIATSGTVVVSEEYVPGKTAVEKLWVADGRLAGIQDVLAKGYTLRPLDVDREDAR